MRHMLLAAYALVCLTCLIWPVYPLIGQHVQPLVLGLPPAFAWVAGWALMTFFALGAYHVADQRAGKSDRDQDE